MDLTTYQEYLNYLTTYQYPNRVHDVNKLREKNLKKSFRQMCKNFEFVMTANSCIANLINLMKFYGLFLGEMII